MRVTPALDGSPQTGSWELDWARELALLILRKSKRGGTPGPPAVVSAEPAPTKGLHVPNKRESRAGVSSLTSLTVPPTPGFIRFRSLGSDHAEHGFWPQHHGHVPVSKWG